MMKLVESSFFLGELSQTRPTLIGDVGDSSVLLAAVQQTDRAQGPFRKLSEAVPESVVGGGLQIAGHVMPPDANVFIFSP